MSTGFDRTTCSYFLSGDASILYAFIHLADKACPKSPRLINGKYVWPVYASFEIFVANLLRRNIDQLTDHHQESGRVFNIFSIDLDGKNLLQITFDNTFDAFPMFSHDGSN